MRFMDRFGIDAFDVFLGVVVVVCVLLVVFW